MRESYPSIVQSLGQQALPTAEYQQATNEAIAPREQALSSRLYSQYAPQYAETGAGIDLNAIQGSGGAAVRASDALDRSINPEFYATRAGASDKLAALLSGIDPNRLTGAETENIARGLARSNPSETGVPSNQGAIRAALTYGSALDAKRNTVANAINSATQALPTFKGADTFGQATGGARSGANVFAGGQGFGGTSGQASAQQGEGVLGITGQLQQLKNQLQAQRRDSLDRYNETWGSTVGSILGCFILREIFGAKLPEYFETWRSKAIRGSVQKQYLHLASIVVPLMRKDSNFKEWVKQNFALPLLNHAKELYAS